jgi:hypothetical protein
MATQRVSAEPGRAYPRKGVQMKQVLTAATVATLALSVLAGSASAGERISPLSARGMTRRDSTWFSVVNRNSGSCVDARNGSAANGTALQQYRCNNTYAQQYVFQSLGNGYYRIDNRNNPNQVWDVTGQSKATFAPVQLWGWWGGANQQWQAIQIAQGYYLFKNRNSGQCLDVPYASTSNSVQLRQYPCNSSDMAEAFLVMYPGSQIGRGEEDKYELGPLTVTAWIDHGAAHNIWQQYAGPAGTASAGLNALKKLGGFSWLVNVAFSCVGNLASILQQVGSKDAGYGVVIRMPYTAPFTCGIFTSVWGQ